MHSVLAVPVRLDVHGVLGVPGCLVCFQSLCAWCALCASCVPCVLVNSGVLGVHVVSVMIGVLGFVLTESASMWADKVFTLQLGVAMASQVSIREMGAQAQSMDLYCVHLGTTAE